MATMTGMTRAAAVGCQQRQCTSPELASRRERIRFQRISRPALLRVGTVCTIAEVGDRNCAALGCRADRELAAIEGDHRVTGRLGVADRVEHVLGDRRTNPSGNDAIQETCPLRRGT